MKLEKLAPWNWFRHEEGPERSHAARSAHPSVGEIDRYFEDALRRFFRGELGSGQAKPPQHQAFPLRAALDIKERKKDYLVEIELPGVSEDEIEIDLDGHRLVVRAEKQQTKESDEEGYHCVERSYGLVQRVLALPEDADTESVAARFRRGVLAIEIAKQPARAQRGRRIAIEGA